ncbi:MAG: UDP-N-acetylmuramate--L-alanine ligase [Deltaproteobacteria bacterium]|nr:UDP-N-acetylmuramate--L-alanine ligase [Deltaproteobacteria bacterium]
MRGLGKTKHIHLVGVGGIGMSGIAELLLNLGYVVSGSDIKVSAVTARLSRLGGRIFSDHSRKNVEGADVVVYSSAVQEDNPEICEAREQYIPVIPRAEMLAELMRLKFGIAVAGAHGKTTTTSMVASILMCGNLDPTVVIGGRLDIWGGANAKLGEGEILVAESDESDGSFMILSPTIAVVTNIDHEHLDHYGNIEAIRQAFIEFINKIPFYGLAALCLDNEEIQGIIPHLKKRYLTYGMSTQADLRARDLVRSKLETGFEVIYRNRSLGRVTVGKPGTHNVLNALGAILVGLELGIGMEDIKKGLVNLGGLARRFEIKGERSGVLVLDDYGHHPTEIAATLGTARTSWPDRRLIIVFQPHRYSRTKVLYDRFVIAFNDADVLVLAPLYSAGERPLEGVDAEWLYRGIKEHGHKEVLLCKDREDIVKTLIGILKPGDVVMTLGAGDIHHVAQALLERLRPELMGH